MTSYLHGMRVANGNIIILETRNVLRGCWYLMRYSGFESVEITPIKEKYVCFMAGGYMSAGRISASVRPKPMATMA